MSKLRKKLRELFFPFRCLFVTGATPGQLRRLFFQFSDLGKVFEAPQEVMEGLAVMAMDSHVMIYTPFGKLALNYTDGRGLAMQMQREGAEWEEVYREQSSQILDGGWAILVPVMPAAIRACHKYRPEACDES